MEMQQESQELINQPSPSEEVLPPQAADSAAPPPAAEAAKPLGDKPAATLEEKIRQKGTVAPPAVKDEAAKAATAAAVAEYKASLKFKAAGKEHDVPKFLHGAMKDAESEKYIHSVLAKAYGLEAVSQKFERVREQRDQVNASYQQVMEPINFAREAYRRDDMDTVFGTLKIDPNKVLQWAYNKVQLSQMPPDQRQVHEARTAAERRAWELEREQQSFSEQSMKAQSEQLNQMLDVVLERPDFGAVAQAYDGRKGKAGAFRDLVVKIGEQEYFASGKVISPMDAAKQAIDLLGEKLGTPATVTPPAPAPAATVTPTAPAAPEPQKKIVLPNAGGAKASAPAKSKLKSLDDIRKLHQSMASK